MVRRAAGVELDVGDQQVVRYDFGVVIVFLFKRIICFLCLFNSVVCNSGDREELSADAAYDGCVADAEEGGAVGVREGGGV